MRDSMYDRVRALVPPETRDLIAVVIGAGMVGSWTSAALLRMCKLVTTVDFDTVEMQNVGVQMYTPDNVGQSKVDALMDYSMGLPLKCIEERMEDADLARELKGVDVVVSAVDSMAGRTWLIDTWDRTRQAPPNRPLFIDVRVMGELVSVLTVHDEQSLVDYLNTLAPDEDIEDAPCGAEGTVYAGMFAAVRVAGIVNNWGRGIDPPFKEVWHTGMMQHLDSKEVSHGTEEARQEGDHEDYGSSSQEDWAAEIEKGDRCPHCKAWIKYEDNHSCLQAEADQASYEARQAAKRGPAEQAFLDAEATRLQARGSEGAP